MKIEMKDKTETISNELAQVKIQADERVAKSKIEAPPELEYHAGH